MSAEFVRERITQLRIQKNVSEHKMSYDLGHNKVCDMSRTTIYKYISLLEG